MQSYFSGILHKYRSAVAVLPLLLIGLVTFFKPAMWFHLIPMASDVRFLDLSLLTFNVDCQNSGFKDLSTINCDPGGRDFNYPIAIFKLFLLLHLNSSSTIYLGFILFMLVVAVLYLLTQIFLRDSANGLEIFLWALIFTSPPVLLLVERGNIDSIMFGLLAIALVFSGNRFLVFSIAIFGFAFKIFLGGLALFGLLKKDRMYFILASLLCLTWFVINFGDFIRVFKNSDYYEWISFGSRALPIQIFDYLAYHPDGKLLFLMSNALGLFFLILVIAILILFKKFGFALPFLFDTSSETKRYRFSYAATVWTVIFFIGLNFDMRLIFLFPVFMQLRTRYRNKLLPVFVFLMYTSFGSYKLQTFGDVILSIFSCLVVFELIRLLMQNFSFDTFKRFTVSNSPRHL
jgi:hypothetical protein